VRLTNLRRRHVWQAVQYALAITARRTSFRICHVSIQRNHVHLIVEANDHVALARGLQGFQISCATQINARLGRREAQPFVHGPFLPVKYPRTFLLAESWKRVARPSARDVPG
jgi:REP element-mobilizing transposase RayT